MAVGILPSLFILPWLEYFLKGPTRPLLSFYFQSFQTNIITFLQQIYVQNVHPVYGAGI